MEELIKENEELKIQIEKLKKELYKYSHSQKNIMKTIKTN